MLGVLDPPCVVTTTLAAPDVPGGVLTMMAVGLMTARPVAALPPMVTDVRFVKPAPEITTEVPPAAGPEAGLTATTAGGARYVNNWFAELVPPGVVTTTLADPAVPAGTVAVIVVALTTVTPLAVLPPTVTAVAPVKPVPVMVTDVPPVIGPMAGLIAVTVGIAA